MDSIGRKFLEETSYSPTSKGAQPFTVGGPPFPPADAQLVSLPEPQFPETTLAQVLQNRRSQRRFSGKPITVETLSWLLWSCAGVTHRKDGRTLRTTPSAGARFPLELLVAVNDVTGISSGIYNLDVDKFALRVISQQEVGRELADACLGQSYMSDAAVNFAWAVIPDRITARYAERSYRYIFLDAGHIVQSLHLACEAVGLGCCAIGAFQDGEVNRVLKVPPEYPVIYLATVGVIAE